MIDLVTSYHEEGFGLHKKLAELPDSMDELIENAMNGVMITSKSMEATNNNNENLYGAV